MHRLARLWIVAAFGVALCAGTAHAHKLKIFAMGDGKTISGYAYFPGGGRAEGLTVTALAPDGSTAGQAVTNSEGEFTIPVEARSDYKLVGQTDDGHRAEFVVEAAELSEDLPEGGARRAEQPKATAPEPATPTAGTDEVRRLVEQAVGEQVRPLREQLESYEEKIRFRDVVGGIGYIIGLAGVAFYFLGVRRRTSPGEGRR
jgi:nickel transport protein